MMQSLILEAMARHVKEKEVLRSSHHGFMNVSNLIAFYSDVTSLAG